MKHNEEELITSIKKLSELELQSLFEGVAEHLKKNKLSHVIAFCFGFDPAELEDLQEQNEALKGEIESLNEKIDDAINALS